MFVETDELGVYDQVYLRTIFESSLNSLMYDWLSLHGSLNYQFGLAYLIDLSCNVRKCLALGSILWCPFLVTAGAARHVLYCCHRG